MILRPTLLAAGAACAILGASPCSAQAPAGTPGTPYRDMPELAPIGVRPDRYLPVPESAKAPPVDPAKGYRTQKLGRDLYLVTDNAYQSMFMVYETGVVVVDAPRGYAKHIRAAITEVTDRPITHLIYSHSHTDHIGGVNALGGKPIHHYMGCSTFANHTVLPEIAVAKVRPDARGGFMRTLDPQRCR